MKQRRKLSSSSSCIRNIRVVLLGQDGVGKSALTVRLVTRRFIGEYDATLESTYRHHIEVDQEFVSLDILDTAGKNTREKLEFCAAFGEMFLILYSITDKTSFYEACGVARYIVQTKQIDSSSLILVGTKLDLEHFRDVPDNQRRQIVNELGCGSYEISISEGYIDTLTMFHEALQHYLVCHPLTEIPMTPLLLANPAHKDLKGASSWSKVKGLKTIPFRRKSVQAN